MTWGQAAYSPAGSALGSHPCPSSGPGGSCSLEDSPTQAHTCCHQPHVLRLGLSTVAGELTLSLGQGDAARGMEPGSILCAAGTEDAADTEDAAGMENAAGHGADVSWGLLRSSDKGLGMMGYWEVTQGQERVRRGGEVGKQVKGVSMGRSPPGQLELEPTGVSGGLPSVTCSHPCWGGGLSLSLSCTPGGAAVPGAPCDGLE